MSVTRAVVEGIQRQGIDERVIYTIDATEWSTSPSGATLRLWEKVAGDWTERTVTLAGATTASAGGAIITCPIIFGGDEGRITRAVVAFTAGSNKFSCYWDVQWEK